MTHALQPFAFHNHQLRIEQDEHGNPWFCAKDVCTILGYANANEAVKYHCKPDGVAKCYPILDTLGRTQYPAFINEGNLYRLIIKSNKPEAAQFESWVCDDVLPAIRKTGGYGVEAPNVAMLQKMVEMQAAMLTMQQQMLNFYADQPAASAMQSPEVGAPRFWTPEEDAKADALRAAGLGCARIGYALNRSRDSIANRFDRRSGKRGAK